MKQPHLLVNVVMAPLRAVHVVHVTHAAWQGSLVSQGLRRPKETCISCCRGLTTLYTIERIMSP